MRAVNLLPSDEQSVNLEGTRTPALMAIGGLVVVTFVAGMLVFSASGTAADKRAELQAVEAAIAGLPKAPTPAVSQGALAQERSSRVVALSAALSSRIAFDRVFRDVSRVLPSDVWLTGVKVLAATPAASAPGASGTPPPSSTPPATGLSQEITITGATFEHASVATVLSRLAVLPSLESLTLTSSSLVQQDAATVQVPGEQAAPRRSPGKPIVTFSISASLVGGSE